MSGNGKARAGGQPGSIEISRTGTYELTSSLPLLTAITIFYPFRLTAKADFTFSAPSTLTTHY